MFKKLSLTAALSAASFGVFAESNAIESVVVSATRTQVDYSETLAAVSVYEREDIDRLQANDIAELLSLLPGVSVIENGGRGANKSLILRGNASDHVLYLIDGVRVGSATLGSLSFGNLNPASVERIEVIRGPKSALYGADAIAGVVNIITRRLKDSNELVLEAAAGSNSTTEFNVFGGVKGDNFQLSVSASAFDTDGIDHTESKVGASADDDAYENRNVALNYIQYLGVAELQVSYTRNEGENQYDSACGDAVTYAPIECFIYSEIAVDALVAKLSANISDNFKTELHLGLSNDESENLASNIDISTTYNGGEFNTEKKEATWLNHLSLNADHTVSFGLDYLQDKVSGSTAYTEQDRYNYAGFVQWQGSEGRFDWVAAIRHDDNEQFGTANTLSATGGYKLDDNWRVIASYGEGFKAPTFNDLYFPFFGDDSFVPEESKNYELGLKGDVAGTYVTLAAFRNEVENLIQYNPEIFASDQITAATIQGVEFDVQTTMGDWQLAANAQYVEPEDKASGNTLRRRAKRSASFTADYVQTRHSFGASVRAVGQRFEDAANTQALGGYALLDLRASFDLNEQVQLNAKVNNAFDKEYTTAFSFGLGAYQVPGREFRLSVIYTPKF